MNNRESALLSINELTLEDMENVNGGGIKEFAAATTLAAMVMTGNTVSAFHMADALAEGSTAHVETAPVEEGEVFGAAFEENAVMASDIGSEVFVDMAEAAVAEEAFSLGENGLEPGVEEEEAPAELDETDLGQAADDVVEELPDSEYVMNVGECSRVPVSMIAQAANVPIDPNAIDGVGIVDESTSDQFNIVRDGGELFIQPKQDIDSLEVGLVSGDQIEVVTLQNVQLDSSTSAAMAAFKDISGEVEKEAKNQAKAWAKKGITALCELIPEGKFCEPVFQKLFDFLTGEKEGPDKLAQISAELGALKEEVKAEAEAIRKNTANVTTLAGYGHYLDLLATSCSKVMMNLKAYGEANLPENDKMVLIASLLTDLDSDRTDNLFGYILMEAGAFNGTSAVSTDGRDLFQVAYDMAVPSAMFSGEAMNLSKDYIRRSVKHFTASYSVATTCLEAYLNVFEFTEDDVLNLGPAAKEKYAQLCKVPETIYNAFEVLNSTILGKDGAMEHYRKYQQTYRFTFINKGKTSVRLSKDVSVKSHKAYGDPDLIDEALKSQPISDEEARLICEHVANVYGTTPYYYLHRTVGFTMPTLNYDQKSYLPGNQSIEVEENRTRHTISNHYYYQGYAGHTKALTKSRVHVYWGKKDVFYAGRPIIFKLAQ